MDEWELKFNNVGENKIIQIKVFVLNSKSKLSMGPKFCQNFCRKFLPKYLPKYLDSFFLRLLN